MAEQKPEREQPDHLEGTQPELSTEDSPESANEREPLPNDALQEQVASISAERDEAKDLFLRTRAEMENYRKRVQREREEERRYANLPLISDLLPALDNLKRAIQAGNEADTRDEALLQGVDMVLKQFGEILGRYGALPINALGETFDPNHHEALQQVPTDEHPPMTVIQELEQGFTLHDRVIRPSKVIVSSAPRPEQKSE